MMEQRATVGEHIEVFGINCSVRRNFASPSVKFPAAARTENLQVPAARPATALPPMLQNIK
jgi:hypothetical protein